MNFTTTSDEYLRRALSILLQRHGSTLLAAILIILPALYLIQIWPLNYEESWLHPELLGTSAYIWNFPEAENFLDRLNKIFDWKAFDPNVNRVRVLNDIAEVIDAIARPYLVKYLGPHPSLTPFALLTAILGPFLLFGYLRQSGLDRVRTAALVSIFLSSIGFLSVTVAYIRPAKKLTILLLCASLYFACRHVRKGNAFSFWIFIILLFLSFFADEMGLANYFIVGVLFFSSLLWRVPNWKRLIFLSLPLLFLISAKWIIPAIYTQFGVHGAWDALADSKKFEVFGFLIEPNFYRVGFIHIARAFLTTIGIKNHSILNQLLALAVLFGGTVWLSYQAKTGKNWSAARYGIIASLSAFFATGFYTTLLDWYPFPNQVSYLGSFTYYYHSSLGILILLWLGFAWQILFLMTQNHLVWHRLIVVGGIAVCAVIVIANFLMFNNINRLVQLIHTYPYSSESIHRQIIAKLPDIRNAEQDQVIEIKFVSEPDMLSENFDSELHNVFGQSWQDNDFYQVFNTFKSNPLMKERHLDDLLHAYFPYNKFCVQVDSDQGVKPSTLIPANPNADFSLGTETDPISGWWISPGDAKYKITRLADENGPFIRIRAMQDEPYLVLTGQKPLTTLDNVLVSLRTQIRANRPQVLTLFDMVESDEHRPYTTTSSAIECWNTLLISGKTVTWPSPSDNYSVGLFEVNAGDWFEVREFGVYIDQSLLSEK